MDGRCSVQDHGAVQLDSNRPCRLLGGGGRTQAARLDLQSVQAQGIDGDRVPHHSPCAPVVAAELQAIPGKVFHEDEITGARGTRNHNGIRAG